MGYSPWGNKESDTTEHTHESLKSVLFSCSVMSDSLRSHESQHARPPCPSPTLGAYPNSCPSSPVMPSSHLILCCPLLLLAPIPPRIREATIRTGHGTTDWFQIGKGVRQGSILSPCLFNLYAEYIMRNTGLEEAQAGIKIAGRNVNNLRYADDTTFMAESEEELKSLLMKVKEESEKVSLRLNIQKTKIMSSGPIISWEIDGETVETVADFIFGGSKITADGDCSHEIKRCLLLGRKAVTNLDSILKS